MKHLSGMAFFAELNRRLAAVSPEALSLTEHNQPRSPDEKVLMVLSDDQRRLAVVVNELTVEIKGLLAEHKAQHRNGSDHSDEDCEAFSRETAPKIDELDTMRAIMWSALKKELPEVPETGIGIRAGGELVELAPTNPIEELLRRSGVVIVGDDGPHLFE
ncbi:MAG: hypothetical protein KGZ30_02400 [Anaplasmataceae bacterium]|nr:hypothetical protein [Anaplasmataceae bacterium]